MSIWQRAKMGTIFASVHFFFKPAGALGVIGPMRINYAKIIPYIEYFTQKLTDLISDEDEHEPGQH